MAACCRWGARPQPPHWFARPCGSCHALCIGRAQRRGGGHAGVVAGTHAFMRMHAAHACTRAHLENQVPVREPRAVRQAHELKQLGQLRGRCVAAGPRAELSAPGRPHPRHPATHQAWRPSCHAIMPCHTVRSGQRGSGRTAARAPTTREAPRARPAPAPHQGDVVDGADEGRGQVRGEDGARAVQRHLGLVLHGVPLGLQVLRSVRGARAACACSASAPHHAAPRLLAPARETDRSVLLSPLSPSESRPCRCWGPRRTWRAPRRPCGAAEARAESRPGER